MKYSFENNDNQFWILYNINSNTYLYAILALHKKIIVKMKMKMKIKTKKSEIVSLKLINVKMMILK